MLGNPWRQLLAALAGSCLLGGAQAQRAEDSFQRVTLDQFMRANLVTQVPVAFELPALYAPVDLPRKRPPTALWLEESYHAEALRTGRMPRQAAHFRGSLAFNVSFDESQGRFLCGKTSCEIGLRDDMARAGYRVLEFERRSIGGTPVMFLTAETATTPGAASAPLYQAYIPLRAGTGVLQIVHRPATGRAAESGATWTRFKTSLTALDTIEPAR